MHITSSLMFAGYVILFLMVFPLFAPVCILPEHSATIRLLIIPVKGIASKLDDIFDILSSKEMKTGIKQLIGMALLGLCLYVAAIPLVPIIIIVLLSKAVQKRIVFN